MERGLYRPDTLAHVAQQGEQAPGSGWYPDPWEAADLRWWDGASWSPAVATLPPLPEPPERTLPIGAFWFAVGASIALVAGTRIVIQNTGNVLSTRLDREVLQWVFYVVLYGGLFLVVRSACRRFGSGSLRDDLGARFRWSDLGFGPVLFIGARVAQVVVTLPLLLGAAAVRNSSKRYAHIERVQSTSSLLTLAVVGILVAPVVEELLFRGVIQRSLITTVGSKRAAVIQGVLFGLYHFAPFLGLYNLLLLTANSVFGIIFGFVARRRRTLGTGMIAHALTNASVVLVILTQR